MAENLNKKTFWDDIEVGHSNLNHSENFFGKYTFPHFRCRNLDGNQSCFILYSLYLL